MKRYLLLLVMYFLATPLFANSITNQELSKACKDKATGPQNFCYGFIIASANAAQFYRNVVDVNDEYIDICFPKDLSNQELVAGYISWVETHTTQLESPALIGVSSSFSSNYSCPQTKKSKKKKLDLG